MRNSKIKIKEILSQSSIQYLSDYEISDIIGNYSKKDFCTDKKYCSGSGSLSFFALLQVQV